MDILHSILTGGLNALGFTIITLMMVWINRYVFLEYSATTRYRKLIGACLIAETVTFAIAFFLDYYIPSKSLQIRGLLLISILLMFLAVGMPHFLYYQKKRFVGFLRFIPLIGYVDVANLIILEIGKKIGGGDQFLQWAISDSIYIVIILIFVLLSSKNTKLLHDIKTDAKKRTLRTKEKVVLWLLGFYLLFENEMYSIFFEKSMPDGFSLLFHFSNALIPIGTVALVLSINRRDYYHEQTVKMQRNLISTMADLVESRDDNTGGHIHRTAVYVQIISRKMLELGIYPKVITPAYVENMVIAAPLHDVGKIHVPDNILNKKGKLDENEFCVMKEHAEYGYEIIQNVEKGVEDVRYLLIAEQMAYYHHEWWNGKGYPNGIAGEEIPVCARIMAVADVFDALISKRCYKEAFSLEKTYAIIREETGTHFDPEVVRAFFAAQEQIESVIL